MKIKKIVLGVFLMLFLWSGIVCAEDEKKIITEFRDTSCEEILVYYKMPLSSLTQKMPASYQVKTEDSDEWVKVPVVWECLDDYENVEYGVYTFVLKPADDSYEISEELTIFEIPYVEVTVDSEIRENDDDIQITVQLKNADSVVIKVRMSDDLDDIRYILYKITGTPRKQIHVYYNGEELEKSVKLSEYGIEHGSVLSALTDQEIEDEKNQQDEDQKDDDTSGGTVDNENDQNDDGQDDNNQNDNDQAMNNQQENQNGDSDENGQSVVRVQNKAVKTGDEANLRLWGVLCAVSVGCAGIVLGLKRKKCK